MVARLTEPEDADLADDRRPEGNGLTVRTQAVEGDPASAAATGVPSSPAGGNFAELQTCGGGCTETSLRCCVRGRTEWRGLLNTCGVGAGGDNDCGGTERSPSTLWASSAKLRGLLGEAPRGDTTGGNGEAHICSWCQVKPSLVLLMSKLARLAGGDDDPLGAAGCGELDRNTTTCCTGDGGDGEREGAAACQANSRDG